RRIWGKTGANWEYKRFHTIIKFFPLIARQQRIELVERHLLQRSRIEGIHASHLRAESNSGGASSFKRSELIRSINCSDWPLKQPSHFLLVPNRLGIIDWNCGDHTRDRSRSIRLRSRYLG